MILDKKLNGILSQEDRALKIFEPSESDKVYEVCTVWIQINAPFFFKLVFENKYHIFSKPQKNFTKK